MHISRNSRILVVSILLITGLLIGGGWIFLHTITVADMTVDGGHIQDISPRKITIRADTPQLNLSISIPNGAILSSQLIIVHNLASDRIQLVDFPLGTQVVRIDATTLQLILPPLLSGNHRFSISTQSLQENEVTIAVLGDSQGFNEALSTIVGEINQDEVDFVLHLGDITPSGQNKQYTDAASAIDDLQIPLYSTPGNHDVKDNGTILYTQFFGPLNTAFTYNGIYFIGLDTSSLGMDSTHQQWLEGQLQQAGTRPIIVYTHVPPVDPRLGNDHGFLDSHQAEEFIALMNQYQVELVMNGHIHLYNTTIHDDILYLTSGGAGASLVASPDQGGFHHYVLVTISLQEIILEPQPVEVPVLPVAVEIRNSANFSMTLGLHDLESLATIQRWGQFENIYSNLRGYGLYRGVLISDLLVLIGGMSSNQILLAEAYDGYQQTYGYSNVYPNTSWYQLQGDFILAFQYNTTLPPEWTDGPRLAFLPLDETYSNLDCEETSYPNQGYHLYPSAGARWIRTVILLQIIDLT
ncbi:MAG: metallophosphoesterase family protein [Promethearchaeota archaeon]